MDVISAVILPKPVLKQVRFGANLRPTVKAKMDGRPGWLTYLASDICFICFLAGHRSANCQHQSRQVRDSEFAKWVLENFKRVAEEQRIYLRSIGRVPVEVLLEEARKEGADASAQRWRKCTLLGGFREYRGARLLRIRTCTRIRETEEGDTANRGRTRAPWP